MDLIEGSDEEEESQTTSKSSSTSLEQTPSTILPLVRRPDRRYLNPAPQTSMLTKASLAKAQSQAQGQALTLHNPQQPKNKVYQTGDLILMNNPKKIALYEPIQGPQIEDPKQNRLTNKPGDIQAKVAFDESTFNEQRNAFQRSGIALAPSNTAQVIVRTTLGYTTARLQQFENEAMKHRKRPRFQDNNREPDPLVVGDDDEIQYGVWGPPTQEELWHRDNSLSDVARGGVSSLAPEQQAEREFLQEQKRQKGIEEDLQATEPDIDRLLERKMAHLLPPRLQKDGPVEPSTKFHGKEEVDYKGNSWMATPPGLGSVRASIGMDDHKCYIPKKCVHRFTGHNKGVHRIRLFPKTGHLLLSGGLDGKCKIWSIADKQVMRTYSGHGAAVRDVEFNHDGTKFVSASFDRYLRLWKTETGEVLQTFTNRKVPYVVKFYPQDDNFFVVGCSDNKIVTYDATTGDVTQEYNHHLAPVNSILFVEDHGTKMITSSDDKKILVWEWDIGVPIKYISDPSMHSMPTMTMHPSQQFFVGQSLDNQIVVFQAQNRFAMQKKRRFGGHQVSGYACEMAFSPDGQFLASGDGNGKLCFWEWKRSKLLQKYKAHDQGPAIGCVWHPLEPSLVFTCGWDAVIKMWQ